MRDEKISERASTNANTPNGSQNKTQQMSHENCDFISNKVNSGENEG